MSWVVHLKCAAIGCDVRYKTHPTASFFCFPDPNVTKPGHQKRLQIWREVSGQTNSLASHKLCHRHFAAHQFYDSDRLRLVRGSVPRYPTGPLNPNRGDYSPIFDVAACATPCTSKATDSMSILSQAAESNNESINFDLSAESMEMTHCDRLRLVRGSVPRYPTGPLNPNRGDYSPIFDVAACATPCTSKATDSMSILSQAAESNNESNNFDLSAETPDSHNYTWKMIEVDDILVQKKKSLSTTELSALSKEELIDKVVQLQAHNIQLRNIIAKKVAPQFENESKGRPFDFSKHPKKHVFMRILYLGWNYQGFACQEDSNETIEFHLMKALLKCKLIENRETSNYHRCGRTDKGVSSFGQVISLTVRATEQGKPPVAYCKMLNRVLPSDIRVVGWREATEGASARFDCKSRSYKYYFPKSSLDLNAMNEAAKYLVGSHDFRNICKMDVGNGVTTFVRNIADASVSTINDDEKGYQMCELSIVGNAFLWHQVRCIASLIILVGQGLENPSIIRELLDVEKNPRKPQYILACPESLNLFKCEYEFDDWNVDDDELEQVIETLQKLWTENQVKTVHIRTMLKELEPLAKREVNGQISSILRRESKQYKSLLTRHKCQSLEDRIEHYAKKRKIDKTT